MATNRGSGRDNDRPNPPRRQPFRPAVELPQQLDIVPGSDKVATDWHEMRRAAGWPPLSENQEGK